MARGQLVPVHMLIVNLLALQLGFLFQSPPTSFSVDMEAKASVHAANPIIPNISIPIKYTKVDPPFISSQKFYLHLNMTNDSIIIPVDIPAGMYYIKPYEVADIARSDAVSLREYKSKIVLRNCAFGDLNTFFGTTFCHVMPEHAEILSHSNLVGEYETVLLICMTFTDFFGHFFIDTIDYLTILPPQLYQSAFFPVFTFKPYMEDFFAVFGIDRNHIVPISPNHFIFAHKLIAFIPAPCCTHSPFLSQKLREFFKSHLGLDKEKPSRYVIVNRKKGSRIIINFAEVCSSIEKKFGQVKWERLGDATDLTEAARFFNSVKLLVGVHGSQMANTIFMQNGTCVCEIHFQYVNTNFMCWMAAIGVSYVFSCVPSFYFEFPAEEPLPTNITDELVKKAFSVLGVK